MTKREAALERIQEVLAGTSDVGERIYRSRVAALARKEFPALVVEPVSDSANRESIDRLVWDFVFQVMILVRDDNPDEAADAIISDVHEKLMGDSTLDAMLVDMNPVSVDWQFYEADKPLCIISAQFRATYQTNFKDLSTA